MLTSGVQEESIAETAQDLITKILDSAAGPSARAALHKVFNVPHGEDILVGAKAAMSPAPLTEQNIRHTLGIVDALRELLQDCTGQRLDEVRMALGKNFIGPEAYQAVFEERVGEIPPLPKRLDANLLRTPCPFTPGRTIADTHILVLVPSVIGVEPATIKSYDALVGEACAKREVDPVIFHRVDWYGEEPFANTASAQGNWALVFKDVVPNTLAASETQRRAELGRYPAYEEARARDLIFAATLNYLQNGERIFSGFSWGKCGDRTSSGAQVQLGCFSRHGLEIFNDYGGYCCSHVGSAVQRTL